MISNIQRYIFFFNSNTILPIILVVSPTLIKKTIVEDLSPTIVLIIIWLLITLCGHDVDDDRHAPGGHHAQDDHHVVHVAYALALPNPQALAIMPCVRA